MRGRPLAVKVGIWVLARDKGDRATFAYRKWIASVNNKVVVARYTSGTMRLHHALDCTPNLPRLPGNRASGSGKISESMQDGAWGWWWEKQTASAQNGFSTAGPGTILGTCQGRHWFEKGRRTEAQRTLALRRRLSKHCRAGAGRFGTARGWPRKGPPWRAVSKFLSSGKSAHSRGLPAAFTGLFLLGLSQHPRICIH